MSARAGPLLLVLAWGCGAPPVDGPYRGEPLLSAFIGRTLTSQAPRAGRYNVMWTAELRAKAPAGWLEHDGGGARTDGAPVTLRLFGPPPAALGVFAVGRIVFYVDAADDGRLGPGDTIHGEADNVALLWAAADLGPGESPLPGSLPAGYRTVPRPLPCGAPDPGACPAPCPSSSACDPLRGRCAPLRSPHVQMVATYEARPLCED